MRRRNYWYWSFEEINGEKVLAERSVRDGVNHLVHYYTIEEINGEKVFALHEPERFYRNKRTPEKITYSKYGPDGYNMEGYNEAGYDRAGFDRDGYYKDGFNAKGFDRDGYYKDGFNAQGLDRDGYNRAGWNQAGINKKTGTQFDINGMDVDGYNKAGFNKDGVDRFGFTKDRRHHITGTDVDEHGYNFYGIDVAGYNRNGIKDPDVELLENYISQKNVTPEKFAREFSKENDLEIEEVKARLGKAALKAPWLQASYDAVIQASMKRLYKSISKDASEVKTLQDLKRFWKIHPKLDLGQLNNMFENEALVAFIDILTRSIKENSIDIELLIRSFSLNCFNLEEGLSELNSLRRTADKDTRFKLNTVEKYMKKFSTKTFYPGTYIVKGVTIVVTEDDIERGKEVLKNTKRFICAKNLEEVCLNLK